MQQASNITANVHTIMEPKSLQASRAVSQSLLKERPTFFQRMKNWFNPEPTSLKDELLNALEKYERLRVQARLTILEEQSAEAMYAQKIQIIHEELDVLCN